MSPKAAVQKISDLCSVNSRVWFWAWGSGQPLRSLQYHLTSLPWTTEQSRREEKRRKGTRERELRRIHRKQNKKKDVYVCD